jgi:tetratricopeptide (TPR) repeat protein
LVRQAALLCNLGGICCWEGRWDEALAYSERGRDELVKVGSIVPAAAANMNIAQILIDRGDVAQAESLLADALHVFKAAQHRYFIASSVMQLGRAALRTGSPDRALKHLGEAKEIFRFIGAQAELLETEARIAECHVHAGDADAAVEAVKHILTQGRANVVAKLIPVLERVRAQALRQQEDVKGAKVALETSLAAARKNADRFEMALSLLALIDFARLEGVEPAPEILTESGALLETLKIKSPPSLRFASK